MNINYKRLKYACYATNITMAVVVNLSPLLFITFHNSYGISYSLLGLLILINCSTQLTIDVIFSLFSHKLNIKTTVRIMPILGTIGLLIYAMWPLIFPQIAYIGLVIGTMLFSLTGGLSEVLITPIIAEIPSDNTEREMSKVQGVYAWGVVAIIVLGTLFLAIVGNEKWYILPLVFAIIPCIAFLLYMGTDIPKMETPEKISGAMSFLKNKELWLCLVLIFLGGASELTMGQWSSSFLEEGMGLSKVWGDIFGVAFFFLMLGLGRTLYGKYGKNIKKVLVLSSIGTTICYMIVAVANHPLIGLIACAMTGFCVSMLWTGSLVIATERFSSGGLFIYALMAAGGDFGASVAPQLVGIVTDAMIANPKIVVLAEKIGLSSSQLGLKFGMLIGMLFPLISIPLFVYFYKKK